MDKDVDWGELIKDALRVVWGIITAVAFLGYGIHLVRSPVIEPAQLIILAMLWTLYIGCRLPAPRGR